MLREGVRDKSSVEMVGMMWNENGVCSVGSFNDGVVSNRSVGGG